MPEGQVRESTNATTTAAGPLIGKLAALWAQVPRFTHDDRVGGRGGYGFTSVDAIQDVLRPLMADAGIVMVPHSMTVITNEQVERIRTTDSGGEYTQYQFRAVLHTEWEVTDGTYVLIVPSIGEAMDTADKAMNKAMTAARKYALVNTYAISTGEDPDKERSGERGSGGDGQARVKDPDAPITKGQVGMLHAMLARLGERSGGDLSVLTAALTAAEVPAENHGLYEQAAMNGVRTVQDSLRKGEVSRVIDAIKQTLGED